MGVAMYSLVETTKASSLAPMGYLHLPFKNLQTSYNDRLTVNPGPSSMDLVSLAGPIKRKKAINKLI